MCTLCSIDLATASMIAPIAQATIISAPILLRGHLRRGARRILTRYGGGATDVDEALERDGQPVGTEPEPTTPVAPQSPVGTPRMLKPPSTYRTSPVTALERSDAR